MFDFILLKADCNSPQNESLHVLNAYSNGKPFNYKKKTVVALHFNNLSFHTINQAKFTIKFQPFQPLSVLQS